MKRAAAVLAAVGVGITLSGCLSLFEPPTPEPPVPALTLTASATVDGLSATVRGCVTGGTPPYVLSRLCDATVLCPAGGVCPTAAETSPLAAESCCYEFVCQYSAPGTYAILVQAQDHEGRQTWTSVTVTVTAPPPRTYTITATAGEGGSISPSGEVPVTAGADVTFTIRVFAGYSLGDVLVDGVSVWDDLTGNGNVRYYTFRNVQANHTIRALFGDALPPGPPGG